MRGALRASQLAGALALATLSACGGLFTPKPLPPSPSRVGTPSATSSAPSSAPATPPATVAVAAGAPTSSETSAERAPTTAPARPLIASAAPSEAARALETRRRALLRSRTGMPADEAGYYIDLFVARVRQLRRAELIVTRQQQRLSLDLSEPAQFEAGSAVLTPASRRALASVSTLLREFDQLLISVHAQADATGLTSDDRRLSEQRALAVAMQFTSGGVATARLIVIGHGGDAPPGALGDGGRERVVIWLDPLLR